MRSLTSPRVKAVADDLDPNVCRGVFGPCSNPVTHHMGDPDGEGAPIPLCEEHWNWALELERALGEDPEFEKRFAIAVEKAGRPTRYQRKPVI